MKKILIVLACIIVGITLFFAANPLYLYINDTDIPISGRIQQASSPSCDINLAVEMKRVDTTCGHPEVFYESHGGVWFKAKWNEGNFLFLKVVRFSNADEHFLEVASGKTDS